MKCECPQRLIHQVTIKSLTYTQDSHNEQIPTEATYASRRAFCRAMTAREVVQSEQVQGAIGWMIELAYDPKTIGIQSDWKMVLHSFGDRVVYCDGPSMPVDGHKRRVRVRGVEQTA